MAPYIKLQHWIAKAEIANAEAARRIGYDRSNFHRITNGTSKPTLEVAHAIDLMTGGEVSVSDWIGFEPVSQERAA